MNSRQVSTERFDTVTDKIFEQAPANILRSVLAALNRKDIYGAINQFADEFTFDDYALGLTFKEKGRLAQFFRKSLEIFPDSVLEVASTLESGDEAIVEWKFTATESLPYGSTQFHLPILLFGVSIAEFRNGKITRWSDYYDQLRSGRVALAAHFTDWVEL